MKKLFLKFLAITLTLGISISSGIALLAHYNGGRFDPICEIERLIKDNRRDDALDMLEHFLDSNRSHPRLAELRKSLEYSRTEKAISFLYSGAIKGEVFDAYSGLGAIAADLCVIGDIRDLGIQSWKYIIREDDFNRLIMLLSGAGVGLSSTGLIKGCNALAKNSVKYLSQIPGMKKRGLLKNLIEKSISREDQLRIWSLLKKTAFQYQGQLQIFQA